MIIAPKRQVLESHVVVENSLFENFTFLDKSGGAISATDIGSCILKYLLFSSCSAKSGGAVAINNTLLFLYSSCFSSCSARQKNEDGGNAFITFGCSFAIDLMSSYMCAPDLANCGDAVFEVRTTCLQAFHTNFSACNGINGECSFGSIDTNTSRVSFMNVVGCVEFSLYLLSGSTLSFANFLGNTLDGLLINGMREKMSIYDSYFFENTHKEDGFDDAQKENIKYYNCFGDISRSGVIRLTEIKTYHQTKIVYQRCFDGSCYNTELHNIQKKFIIIIFEILKNHHNYMNFMKMFIQVSCFFGIFNYLMKKFIEISKQFLKSFKLSTAMGAQIIILVDFLFNLLKIKFGVFASNLSEEKILRELIESISINDKLCALYIILPRSRHLALGKSLAKLLVVINNEVRGAGLLINGS